MDADVLVIGAGQCGLALSRELTERHVDHVVIDAHDAPGDVWRDRWDSLRLFTPARFDALPGSPLPGSQRRAPTAAEFGAYLDDYAEAVGAPLRPRTTARCVTPSGGGFVVAVSQSDGGTATWHARRVVIATGAGRPAVPSVAGMLDAGIRQLHSAQYHRPDDLPPGRVLVVGCGTSGVQLGVELSRSGREVVVAGDPTAQIPAALLAVAGGLWFGLLHRVLTRATPWGRRAAPAAISAGAPLVGIGVRDLQDAGATRGARLTAVHDGMPQLADGRVLEPDAVLWATGFRPGFDWIDGLATDEHGLPAHDRGVSTAIPGLCFLGLPFLFGLTSTLIGGAGRDAAFLAARLTAA